MSPVKLLITICFFLLALKAIAMPTDHQEKVFIVADTNTYNYKTGVNVFEGNVKVDQGTTHITADKLITKRNQQHKVEEAIAYGITQPAHYWTVPKLDEKEIHAHAKIIKFYPITSNIVLEQQVTVMQGENSFKGEVILYNMHDQTITVPASKNGRAVLVYNPDK